MKEGESYSIQTVTIRKAFSLIFLFAIFAMSARATIDPDMWWHLRTGESILANGIPHQDIFSYTVPQHEWITHEWLSQVVMWRVWQAGQWPLLILFFAAINTLAFWLVYQRCDGRPYLAAFVLLLAAIVSSIIWGSRPQMFNILMVAGFIYVVEGVRQRKLGEKWLWILPALTIIWANLHSGYLLGVVLLGTYLVGDACQRYLTTRTTPSGSYIRRLALITGLSFVMAALNPNGVKLWIYPFLTLGSRAMQTYIQEWHSPDFHHGIFQTFAALFFLGILTLILSPKRPTWTDLLLFLGTGAAGLLSARHIPLFALVAAPIISHHLSLLLEEMPAFSNIINSEGVTGKPLLNWLLVAVMGFGAVVWIADTIINNEEVMAEHYPVAAVDYLIETDLAQEQGYNSYNWGGYLIWRGLPVFIDGRADVYGDEFIFKYRQTFDPQSSWQEPLAEFDVSYVLMEKESKLTTLLTASPDWQEMYVDEMAQIFIRNN